MKFIFIKKIKTSENNKLEFSSDFHFPIQQRANIFQHLCQLFSCRRNCREHPYLKQPGVFVGNVHQLKLKLIFKIYSLVVILSYLASAPYLDTVLKNSSERKTLLRNNVHSGEIKRKFSQNY